MGPCEEAHPVYDSLSGHGLKELQMWISQRFWFWMMV